MKISKREIEWEFKTRNRERYFTISWWIWHWVFGVGVEIENYHKDYTEINLSILCFYFSFVSFSHGRLNSLDKLFGELEAELRVYYNERT